MKKLQLISLFVIIAFLCFSFTGCEQIIKLFGGSSEDDTSKTAPGSSTPVTTPTDPGTSTTEPNSPPPEKGDVFSDTYLFAGYDVINSGYINGGESKKTMPILDINKLFADNLVVRRDTSKTNFIVYSGENIREVYKQINSGINAEVNWVFSGKASSEFEKSSFEQTTHRYAKGLALHTTMEEYLRDASPENLRKYLSDSFTEALKNRDAAYILDRYGTHLIVRCYWGGSIEFNFSYYGEVLKTSSAVSRAVEAKYKIIEAGAARTETTETLDLSNNSTFKYRTNGGNNTSFTSLDSLMAGYGAWIKSISDKPDLCGIDDFRQSLIPIWELVTDPVMATNLEKEFGDRAVAQGIKLGEWQNLIVKTAEYNTRGSSTFTYDGKFPAKIEVYAIGAGGGGQGESRNKHTLHSDEHGTGGGGGGGALTYISFIADQPVNISLLLGQGGNGGTGRTNDEYSGYPGTAGGSTTATWNGITITAAGGRGGGTGSTTWGGWTDVRGGAGGKATINVASSPLLADYKLIDGNKGDDGDPYNGNKQSYGGNPGGRDGVGGTGRGSNTGNMNGSKGGGGAGAAWSKSSGSTGGKGGDGYVLVKYTFYDSQP